MERTQTRQVLESMRKVATVAESSHEMHQHSLAPLPVEDAGMEDMIEALVENVLPDEAMPKKSKARDKMEDFVRKTCKEPLYVGRKCLKIEDHAFNPQFASNFWMVQC